GRDDAVGGTLDLANRHAGNLKHFLAAQPEPTQVPVAEPAPLQAPATSRCELFVIPTNKDSKAPDVDLPDEPADTQVDAEHAVEAVEAPESTPGTEAIEESGVIAEPEAIAEPESIPAPESVAEPESATETPAEAIAEDFREVAQEPESGPEPEPAE